MGRADGESEGHPRDGLLCPRRGKWWKAHKRAVDSERRALERDAPEERRTVVAAGKAIDGTIRQR